MRIYSDSSQEMLRAREFLKDWTGESLLSQAQYQLLEKENASGLRTTNIFLRLVLFLFTLISLGAGAGLFFEVFLSRPTDQTVGPLLMIFAALCYVAAETAISRGRLYRYGIEEGLAVSAVAFLCVGMQLTFFSGGSYLNKPNALGCLVPAVGAAVSLWIWRRLGLSYAFLAAMIFALFIPGYWTQSRPVQHLVVAGFYAMALASTIAVRSRHRYDYLDGGYSLVEAFLWLGIYLTINLRLSSFNLLPHWWGGTRAAADFPALFYWGTWVMIWCLPAIVLARGVGQRDRFVIAVGTLVAVLTLVSNKPYLGWPRHTWDPMLLGLLLAGVAVFLRRWLAGGPGGIRHGFNSARLSGKDKPWIDAGSSLTGLLVPQPSVPLPGKDFRFDGGQSGGGGASGDF